ncbi:hypothetical protein P261_00353 [Lachnospiraceae bacterium TWA4]|nr:hypothetical protein P261_00353 [Lachnospiraceae bacterium TWA4]
MGGYTSQLDIQKVRQSGEDLITNVEKIYSSLTKISELINGSKSYFDSQGGDSVRKKFSESAQNFETFKKSLISYGEWLKSFSGNVQSYNNAVQEAVEKFESL